MSRHDPKNNAPDAFRTVVLPHEYQNSDINRLFQRAYDPYDGETDPLVEDIEQFFKYSLNENVVAEAASSPVIRRPATFALLASLAGKTVQEHEALQSTPPSRLKLLEDLGALYTNNLMGLIRSPETPSIEQDLAEFLYRKPEPEDGTIPGRICTGIKERPDLGDGQYVEIPLAAASRQCIYRADDDENGEILTKVADNNLYIPLHLLYREYRDYAEEGFKRLLSVQEKMLTDDQRAWLRNNVDYIIDRIDRFFQAGQEDRVWKNWSRPERKLRFLVDAVEEAPDKIATIGEPLRAEQLRGALEYYSPDHRWEESYLNELSSPSRIGGFLQEQEDHGAVTIHRDQHLNRYELSNRRGSAKALDIDELEDLFELPCLAALDERLHEEKPVRKDLYSLVRLIIWLPRYQPDPDLDRVVEDVKDLFSRWPWYDADITEYQVKYEFLHGTTASGDEYLPLSCGNETMQRYCIGRDDCDYSIYQSIDFPDKMYAQLDGDHGSLRSDRLPLHQLNETP